MNTFALPDLGEGLVEAEIVAWHVGPGDHVVADQPLLSVETDKAVVEIPAPHAGHIEAIHGEPGDVVAVGAPLVEFAAPEAGTTGETVVGALPHAAPGAGTRPASRAPASHGRASPAVRALAGRLGVDLDATTGSGPGGAVTRADVESAARDRAPGDTLALRGVRRAMARNMSRAHAEVVPATLTDAADVHAWPTGTDVTLRLVRAIGAACRAEPALNAWFLGADAGRRVHARLDLGIATDTPDGLFVPVLRDAAGRGEPDLRAGLERMKSDLAARAIPQRELRDPTFTLSNFGMLGGEHAALVVMPPQVGILGAGRLCERARVHAGAVVARRTLPLSLTFDHRAVSGGEAARFMAAVIRDLEAG